MIEKKIESLIKENLNQNISMEGIGALFENLIADFSDKLEISKLVKEDVKNKRKLETLIRDNLAKNLIRNVKIGCAISIECIIALFDNLIKYFSNKFIISGYTKEDIQSECKCSIVKCIQKFDENKGSFSSYLFGAMQNDLSYILRKQNRYSCLNYVEVLVLTDVLENIISDPDANVETSIMYETLLSSLDFAEPHIKDAIIHFHIENLRLTDYCTLNNLDYKSTNYKMTSTLKRLKQTFILNYL